MCSAAELTCLNFEPGQLQRESADLFRSTFMPDEPCAQSNHRDGLSDTMIGTAIFVLRSSCGCGYSLSAKRSAS